MINRVDSRHSPQLQDLAGTRLLFINGLAHSHSKKEQDIVFALCDLAGIDRKVLSLKTLREYRSQAEWSNLEQLRSYRADFLYVAGHSDSQRIGDFDDKDSMTWEVFADSLSDLNIVNAEATVFLGCCFGGLKGVAEKVFHRCPAIDAVCGPKNKVCSIVLMAAISSLFCNLFYRRRTAKKSVLAASHASDDEFAVFHRVQLGITSVPKTPRGRLAFSES